MFKRDAAMCHTGEFSMIFLVLSCSPGFVNNSHPCQLLSASSSSSSSSDGDDGDDVKDVFNVILQHITTSLWSLPVVVLIINCVPIHTLLSFCKLPITRHYTSCLLSHAEKKNKVTHLDLQGTSSWFFYPRITQCFHFIFIVT